MDAATRADMAQWTGCIAGALTRDGVRRGLTDAGLIDIEIHRDPPRPRARRLGDHPRAQAVSGAPRERGQVACCGCAAP